MESGFVWRGAWEEGAERAEKGLFVAFASWARGEPERGRYDDAELLGYRRALGVARKRGAEPMVVVHAGALPDWQVARGGWLDPDALALWGCWVDRLAQALNEATSRWIALWDPLGEAGGYDRDARRVGRVLLDAQAAAYLQLRRGAGVHKAQVGALVTVGAAETGFQRRARGLAARIATEAWVRAASTGRLGPPFALTGELSNGTAALDFLGVRAAPGASLTTLAGFGRPLVRVGREAGLAERGA